MEPEHKEYSINGIKLHVVEAGKAEGDILLFLHGFPEYWWGWRYQISYFATQGYRVIVPDQRGYNLSSKPAGIKAYGMQQLSDDIAGLIQKLGAGKVVLLGHDWGGAVAWVVAIRYPQLLEKLIVLNLPHPSAMRQGLRRWPKQLLKSWYIGFFQLSFLPEKILSLGKYTFLAQSMLRSSEKGTFSPEDLQRYKEAWQQPGALTAMLNWYRAAFRGTLKLSEKVSTPTLLIWGKQDQFLSHEMAQLSMAYCENGQLEMIEDATHWVQHEKADRVNELIHGFIR